MFNFDGKKNNRPTPAIIFQEATKGISLNPDAFSYDAECTVNAYLQGIYSQDISILPNNKVTEEMFYHTKDIISSDLRCICRAEAKVTITNVKFSDYSSNRYSIRSFSFDMSYEVSGLYGKSKTEMYPYREVHTDTFTFVNDARLGFILADHKINA